MPSNRNIIIMLSVSIVLIIANVDAISNMIWKNRSDTFENDMLKIEYKYTNTPVCFSDCPTEKRFFITNKITKQEGRYSFIDGFGYMDTTFRIDSTYKKKNGELTSVLEIVCESNKLYIDLQSFKNISQEFVRRDSLDGFYSLTEIVANTFSTETNDNVDLTE